MGEKMIDRMGRIMRQPLQIRNICTSAHIHHGKTAFTDNLLAAAGLMAETFAGDLDKGMVTWQHSDEQERLLTVDAANVSMVHEFQGKEYLINLIDTPGHVDFGGSRYKIIKLPEFIFYVLKGDEPFQLTISLIALKSSKTSPEKIKMSQALPSILGLDFLKNQKLSLHVYMTENLAYREFET